MKGGSVRLGYWKRRISSASPWMELLFILFLTIAFCSDILDLDPQQILPGNESDIVQSLDWTLINSLRNHGSFPLWNPYLKTGMPYVADPFLHVFNPLSTIPILLFGVQAGFKIALFLSFFAAGAGMWWLGKVLGFRPPSRVWMGLMYAFTGQAVARFFQGEYDFVLGYAWIPWVFAALIGAVNTKKERYAAAAAFSMALLFFSGNAYYAFYMLFAIAIFSAVNCAQINLTERTIAIDMENAKILALIGVLALGLIAIQFLPMAEFWPYTSKFTTEGFRDSHSIRQIFLDYLSKEHPRPDVGEFPPPEEYYAYTGIWPFLALGLLPFAVKRRRRGTFLFFGLTSLFAFAWIDVRDMPWRGIYLWLNSLIQFRYPTRMLIYGAVAILALAGLGINDAWRRMSSAFTSADEADDDGPRRVAAGLGLAVISVFMLISVADVLRTNSEHVYTRDRYDIAYEMMDWLSEYDQSEYYVGNLLNWHAPTISNGLRYIDGWYGFFFHPPRDHIINDRPVVARPNYIILGNDQAPEGPAAIVAKAFETHTIYELPDSLPFAFTVSDEDLIGTTTDQELKMRDVSPLPTMVDGPNRVRIRAQGDTTETLVTLMAQYPGWKVYVDGRPNQLINVGGYLAADLSSGEHTYEFVFSPASFFLGLAISTISLLATLGLIARDLEVQKRVLGRRRIPRLSIPPFRLPTRQPAVSPSQARAGAPPESPPAPASKGSAEDRSEARMQLEQGQSGQFILQVDPETEVILTVSVEATEDSLD